MTRSNVEQLVKRTSAMFWMTASFRLLLLKLWQCKNGNISKGQIYSLFLNVRLFAEVREKRQAYLISLTCGHFCIAEARVVAPTPVRLVATNLAIKTNIAYMTIYLTITHKPLDLDEEGGERFQHKASQLKRAQECTKAQRLSYSSFFNTVKSGKMVDSFSANLSPYLRPWKLENRSWGNTLKDKTKT